MTRENKIALVVGFALILVVGILVSDHFSVARTQQSAELLPARDPLGSQRRSDPGLLRYTPNRRAPLVADDRGTSPFQSPSAEDGAPPAMRFQPPPLPRRGADQPVHASSNTAGAEAEAPDYTFHRIAPGESLTSICKRYYGDDSVVRDVARFNGINDPDLIVLDQRLKLPAATTLGIVNGRSTARPRQATTPPRKASRNDAPRPDAAPSGSARADETYTVRTGDVLSVIASRTLGSSRRWSEIYELNRDRISDPDHVTVGTVLRLPAH
jgi:nucleoid-associated protein YgaU